MIDEHGRVCTKCFVYKTWDKFYKKLHGNQIYRNDCMECVKARGRRTGQARRLRAKERAIAQYGGFCACCGETELTFLTIDHVNNDGAEHRREIGSGGSTIYWWLSARDWPPGYQVLCMNCNLGRQLKGTCPHALGLAGLKEAG